MQKEMQFNQILKDLENSLIDWKSAELNGSSGKAARKLFGPNKEKKSKKWFLTLNKIYETLQSSNNETNVDDLCIYLVKALSDKETSAASFYEQLQKSVCDFFLEILESDSFSDTAKAHCINGILKLIASLKSNELKNFRVGLLDRLTHVLSESHNIPLLEGAANLLNAVLSGSNTAKESLYVNINYIHRVLNCLVQAQGVFLQLRLVLALSRILKRTPKDEKEFAQNITKLLPDEMLKGTFARLLYEINSKNPLPGARRLLDKVNWNHSFLNKQFPVTVPFSALSIDGNEDKSKGFIDFNVNGITFQFENGDYFPTALELRELTSYKIKKTVSKRTGIQLGLELVANKGGNSSRLEFALVSSDKFEADEMQSGILSYFQGAKVVQSKASSPERFIMLANNESASRKEPSTAHASLLGYDEEGDTFFNKSTRYKVKRSLKSLPKKSPQSDSVFDTDYPNTPKISNIDDTLNPKSAKRAKRSKSPREALSESKDASLLEPNKHSRANDSNEWRSSPNPRVLSSEMDEKSKPPAAAFDSDERLPLDKSVEREMTAATPKASQADKETTSFQKKMDNILKFSAHEEANSDSPNQLKSKLVLEKLQSVLDGAKDNIHVPLSSNAGKYGRATPVNFSKETIDDLKDLLEQYQSKQANLQAGSKPNAIKKYDKQAVANERFDGLDYNTPSIRKPLAKVELPLHISKQPSFDTSIDTPMHSPALNLDFLPTPKPSTAAKKKYSALPPSLSKYLSTGKQVPMFDSSTQLLRAESEEPPTAAAKPGLSQKERDISAFLSAFGQDLRNQLSQKQSFLASYTQQLKSQDFGFDELLQKRQQLISNLVYNFKLHAKNKQLNSIN